MPCDVQLAPSGTNLAGLLTAFCPGCREIVHLEVGRAVLCTLVHGSPCRKGPQSLPVGTSKYDYALVNSWGWQHCYASLLCSFLGFFDCFWEHTIYNYLAVQSYLLYYVYRVIFCAMPLPYCIFMWGTLILCPIYTITRLNDSLILEVSAFWRII